MARASFCWLTAELLHPVKPTPGSTGTPVGSAWTGEGARPHTSPSTLLAVAILSLGSVPATAAAEPGDFCNPTYPSDASFCISEELNSAEGLPASPLKWRSNFRAVRPWCRAWPSNFGRGGERLQGGRPGRRVRAWGANVEILSRAPG